VTPRRARWHRRRLRIERALLGMVMSVLAFGIERALLRWSRQTMHATATPVQSAPPEA
jgi:hypothetical protein